MPETAAVGGRVFGLCGVAGRYGACTGLWKAARYAGAAKLFQFREASFHPFPFGRRFPYRGRRGEAGACRRGRTDLPYWREAYGYGNVVYVAHPDGNISVYGHLSKFTPEVEAYVRSERYRQQRNDIDLFPEAGRFPVKRGEVIGLSGNSGNSFGPHLHFEIREGASQRTVNPIARGYYRVKDDLPPRIFGVSYYLVDTLMGVPVHTLAGRAAAIGGSGARYTLEAPMVLPAGGISAWRRWTGRTM